MERCEICNKNYTRIGFHMKVSHGIEYFAQITCVNCNKEFPVKYRDRNRRFCGHSCELSYRNKENWKNLDYIERMRKKAYDSGFNKINIGKSFSQEHCQKIGVGRKQYLTVPKHRVELSKSIRDSYTLRHKKINSNTRKRFNPILNKTLNKKKWKNLEFRKNWIEKALPKILKSSGKRPNKMEIKLDGILQNNFPGEWKYVGDGSVWVQLFSYLATRT